MLRYVIASVVLVALDVSFIRTVVSDRYKPMVTRIQGQPPIYRPIFGIITYAFMLLGLNLFVIPNIHTYSRWADSLVYGGGFGFCTFGMYSFTAMTVFHAWSLDVALADTAWGVFLYGASAVVSSYV